MYPVQLTGRRVLLREFEPGDLDATLGIVGDDEVTHFLSFASRTRDEQSAILSADIERARCDPRPDYSLAVVESESGALIGFVRMGLMRHSGGEIGYATRRDRWRRGLTAEAVSVMLDFSFETLELHRVQAACGPRNTGSQALLAKLGFQREGVMRDHVFTNGARRDSILYSLLRHEWASR